MSYGQNSKIGISFQNSYGTPLQNSVFWIPKLSESINIDKPPLIEQNLRGVFDEGAHHEGLNTISGSLEAEAAPIPLGVMLKCVMGDPATVTSDSLYTHTFKPRTSDWDSLCANVPVTIEKYVDAGSADLFYDMTGSMLELSIANGEFVKAKVDFVGGQYTQQGDTAESYPSTTLWSWDATSVSIGGSGKPEIMDMTLTLNENLEAQGTLDATKTPSRIKRTGFRTMEIGGTVKFDNTDEYDAFLKQSERELIVHFEGTTQVQSGYNEALTVTVPLMRHVDFKPAAGGPGELEVSFSSKGVYSVTSATAMQIELRNSQSGY